MRIAFYAPMKPPCHPLPSGDRTMARALCSALARAGHTVELASGFCSYDGSGDAGRQYRLAALGNRIAGRLVQRWQSLPADRRPRVWFTYHLYHKAPDCLGPAVSRALALPYLVAEASFAGKRLSGPWAAGAALALDAIRAADGHLLLNPADAEGLLSAGVSASRMVPLAPFIDAAAAPAGGDRLTQRAVMARRYALPVAEPWLLAVGMFRFGDKLASYQVLGDALARISDRPWRLIVAGRGPARADVAAALAAIAGRARWLDDLDGDALVPLYRAADLLVWPAIGEAFGIALLEAQAFGLPVVAGRSGGVAGVVAHGETGILVPPGDAGAFADRVAALLDDPARRRRMGEAAVARTAAAHDLCAGAVALDGALRRFAPSGKTTP